MKHKTYSGQECCSLHGWIKNMMDFDADYAVIIHSDKDCTNLIPADTKNKCHKRIFCSNLTDLEIIEGTGLNKLENAIHAVIIAKRPSSVVILGSCMQSIIHDDVEGLLKRVKLQYPQVTFHYEKTSGLAFHDPRDVMDNNAVLMFNLSKNSVDDNREENSINIIGFDGENKDASYFEKHKQALVDDLKTLGVKVNSILNGRSSAKEWGKAKNAALTVSFDKRLFVKFCKELENTYGIPTIESPYPAGVYNTLYFIKKITDTLKIPYSEKIYALKTKIDKTKTLQDDLKIKIQGKTVLYNIATSLDFSVLNSAKEGLLYLRFFKEIGLNVHLLIQGNPEEEHRKEIEQALKDAKIHEKFTIFGHCGDAYTVFKKYPGAIVYGSSAIRDQAQRNGNTFISNGILSIGLEGTQHNIEVIYNGK
jgi:nitrogenase molybdenum-iron protein alpha/beta subunit